MRVPQELSSLTRLGTYNDYGYQRSFLLKTWRSALLHV